MRNNGHGPASAARADATLTDEQLMLELAHGRHEALGSLYSRHSRLVFYLALQSLERPAAEELVQEVFLTIWRGASAFDPEQGSFRPWLLRLAHWRILNELRRRHRRPQVQRNVDEEDELFQQVLDQEPGPEERAFQKEHRRIVDSALEALPPKQREAVALAFLEDMTHEQVAEALDVPLGTAKTRIRSGLHGLRMVLAPVAASLFGLGFAVRVAHGLSPLLGSKGDAHWGGITGPAFWIDSQEELLTVLMVQAPRQRFYNRMVLRNLVYGAMTQAR